MSETDICVAPDEGYFNAWRISNEDALERLRGAAAMFHLHVGDHGGELSVLGEVSDGQLDRLLLRFSGYTGLAVEAVQPRRAMPPLFDRLLKALPGGMPLLMWTNRGDEPELESLAADPTVMQIVEVLDRLG